MHVSNLIDIDYMVAPDLHIGVDSTDALNGYKSYGIITKAIGTSGDVIQSQHCNDGSEFHRIRHGAVWGEWSAGTKTYEYIGKMVFDEDLGKPLWISEVKPYVHAQQKLTVNTPPNIIGSFSITCGPASSDNANCSFWVGAQSVSFTVVSTDTGADIAAKLATKSPVGYNGSVDGNVVTFTRTGGGGLSGEGLLAGTSISIVDDGSGATYAVGSPDIEPRTLAGDLTIKFGDDVVTLAVVQDSSAYFIVDDLAALFADDEDWDTSVSHGSTDSITFTAKTPGVRPDMQTNAGVTQVLLSVEEITRGSASVFVDATGQVVYQ